MYDDFVLWWCKTAATLLMSCLFSILCLCKMLSFIMALSDRQLRRTLKKKQKKTKITPKSKDPSAWDFSHPHGQTSEWLVFLPSLSVLTLRSWGLFWTSWAASSSRHHIVAACDSQGMEARIRLPTSPYPPLLGISLKAYFYCLSARYLTLNAYQKCSWGVLYDAL